MTGDLVTSSAKQTNNPVTLVIQFVRMLVARFR